jgi:hypothetical protein
VTHICELINALCWFDEGLSITARDIIVALFEVINTITMQAMYVQHDIEVRSCNHCCGGKAMVIT